MVNTNAQPTAAMVIIGNEILSGRTQDTNLNYLAKTLGGIGIRLMEVRVVSDLEEAIVGAVNSLRISYDYVFTTGGIGPTHDDITSVCIAKAFGLPYVRHPDAEARLKKHYKPEDLNAARLKMADMPEGAALIDNPVSAAPGFIVKNVHVMAGVPRIFQAMLESIKGRLKGGDPIISRTLSCHLTEGMIAAELGAIQLATPQVEIGSYPFIRDGKLGVSLVSRSDNKQALDEVVESIRAVLQKHNTIVTEE